MAGLIQIVVVKMGITFIIFLIVMGSAAGLASGLLGVGGGFIMVPAQYWVLIEMGIEPAVAVRTAFGTGLLVIIPTALSGAAYHHKKRAVLWDAAKILGISGAAGAVLGGTFASHLLPAGVLKIIFGGAVLLGAVRMLVPVPVKNTGEDNPCRERKRLALWGFPLGFISGLIGIGGGALMIPVMVLALRFKMHQAVGTSTALISIVAIGGTLAYLFNGLGVPGLSPYSVGYLNLLQFVILAGASIPAAVAGAGLAHKLPAKRLKLLFVVILFYAGLKMVGLFDWLNLPV